MIHAGRQQQKAIAEYHKAISFSPNNADLLAEYGWSIPLIGKVDEGVTSIKLCVSIPVILTPDP
jgi:Tfp pilus assembly protein PilF